MIFLTMYHKIVSLIENIELRGSAPLPLPTGGLGGCDPLKVFLLDLGNNSPNWNSVTQKLKKLRCVQRFFCPFRSTPVYDFNPGL